MGTDVTSETDKTFLEFFAGIGLVHEALKRSGWRCLYANDIDEHKRRMYLRRFPEADAYYHLGDVWETEAVVERAGAPALLATASFPCTDMSLAGRRRGFQGPESSAFFGFARVLERLGPARPALVLIENVAGFLGARGGRDFEAAVRCLAELGYWLDAFLLDARHFTAQSRPRLFLLGFHQSRDWPPLVRDDPTRLLDNPWEAAVAACSSLRPPRLLAALRRVRPATGWALVPTPPPPHRPADLADVLDWGEDQRWWDAAMVDKHYRMMHERHRRVVDQWLESGERRAATVFRRIREGRQRAEVRLDGLAGCLRTPRGGSARQIVLVADRGRLRMRWMTPREYARLQGVPDWPVDGDADSRALFGLGDAVCVPVICWIDQHILTPLARTGTRPPASRHG